MSKNGQSTASTEPLVKILDMRRDFSLADMIPFEKNPRLNDQVVTVLERSLSRFGPVEPIILDQDHRICAGHTRWKAAKARGDSTFPVIICEFASEAAFVGYNITSNRTAQLAQWDLVQLQAHIDAILAAGISAETLGFDEAELARVAAEIAEPDFDPADIDEQGRLDRKDPITCPNCGHSWVP